MIGSVAARSVKPGIYSTGAAALATGGNVGLVGWRGDPLSNCRTVRKGEGRSHHGNESETNRYSLAVRQGLI